MCSGLSGFGSVAVLLVVLGIAVLVVYLLIERWGRAGRAPVETGNSEHAAVALLKERLARSDIDTDDFERRLLSLSIH